MCSSPSVSARATSKRHPAQSDSGESEASTAPHSGQERLGLEMMIGHVGIAKIIGPDEDMTKPMMEPVKLTICESCVLEQHSVAVLAEIGHD